MLCKHIQRQRVDTLLVKNHKALFAAVANLFLELDNLCQPCVHEFAFGFRKLFTLLRTTVEESGVDLAANNQTLKIK